MSTRRSTQPTRWCGGRAPLLRGVRHSRALRYRGSGARRDTASCSRALASRGWRRRSPTTAHFGPARRTDRPRGLGASDARRARSRTRGQSPLALQHRLRLGGPAHAAAVPRAGRRAPPDRRARRRDPRARADGLRARPLPRPSLRAARVGSDDRLSPHARLLRDDRAGALARVVATSVVESRLRPPRRDDHRGWLAPRPRAARGPQGMGSSSLSSSPCSVPSWSQRSPDAAKARTGTLAAVWCGITGGLAVFVVWVIATYAQAGGPYDAGLVRDFHASSASDLTTYAVSDDLGSGLVLLLAGSDGDCRPRLGGGSRNRSHPTSLTRPRASAITPLRLLAPERR